MQLIAEVKKDTDIEDPDKPKYVVEVRKAIMIFQYHLVYNMEERTLVNLNKMQARVFEEDLGYLGPYPLLLYNLLYIKRELQVCLLPKYLN